MKKHSISLSIVLSGLIVASLHYFALQEFLYWQFWWFDILMHTLGGFLVGLFFLRFYSLLEKENFKTTSKKTVFINMLLFSLIVGFSWEAFENIYGLTIAEKVAYRNDTMLDFVMNTIGATVSLFYFYFLTNIITKKHGE